MKPPPRGPFKVTRKGFHEQQTVFKPHEMGIQEPCRVDSEMPPGNALPAISGIPWRTFHELARRMESNVFKGTRSPINYTHTDADPPKYSVKQAE
jgi:hypothetical protein